MSLVGFLLIIVPSVNTKGFSFFPITKTLIGFCFSNALTSSIYVAREEILVLCGVVKGKHSQLSSVMVTVVFTDVSTHPGLGQIES